VDWKHLLRWSVVASLIGSSAVADDAAGRAGDAARGETLFKQYCGTCHGADARGVPHLGKDLTASKFAGDMSDAQLLEFIRKGRPANDALNTTGIPMPPSAGNPSLTDDQIHDIITYLRSIQKK